jgi:cobalt/nickel transport system ATP-binding protein
MLLATHDLDLARALCRRVILLKDGSVFADGLAAEVLDNEVLLETCGL